MPYTRSLVDFLPRRIKERVELDEDTSIGHVIAAIQPSLDIIIDAIEGEADFYDPAVCPPQFLDWMGQLIGLARAGNDYLGLGIDPQWSDARKRQAISLAWQYWQVKGTRMGVDLALKIWLDWEPSISARIEKVAPFGGSPTHSPPMWAGWNAGYYQELLLPIRKVRQLGGGGIPDADWYLSHYLYLPPIDLEFSNGKFRLLAVPNPETLVADINASRPIPDPSITAAIVRAGKRQLLDSTGAAHQSNCHWQHLFGNESDWLKVAPDIADLNREIWSASAQIFPATWLDLTALAPVNLATLTPIDVFTKSGSWQLTIITSRDAYVVHASNGYLLDGTTPKFLRTRPDETQYLEWFFTPLRADRIQRIQLSYQGAALLDYVPAKPLPIDPRIQVGITAIASATTSEYLPTVGIVLDPPSAIQIVGVTTSGLATLIEEEGSPTRMSGPAIFTFNRGISSSSTRSLTIYFTLAGTANYGTDYNIESASNTGYDGIRGFVTFAPNQLSVNVRFYAVADIAIEPDETVILRITPNPAIVVDALSAVATWTILDDDALYLAINGGTFVRDYLGRLISITPPPP